MTTGEHGTLNLGSSHAMLALAAVATYVLFRYGIGLLVRNRFVAAALTFTSLAALAMLAFGAGGGRRAAGVLLVCALIDAAWKRPRRSKPSEPS